MGLQSWSISSRFFYIVKFKRKKDEDAQLANYAPLLRVTPCTSVVNSSSYFYHSISRSKKKKKINHGVSRRKKEENLAQRHGGH